MFFKKSNIGFRRKKNLARKVQEKKRGGGFRKVLGIRERYNGSLG